MDAFRHMAGVLQQGSERPMESGMRTAKPPAGQRTRRMLEALRLRGEMCTDELAAVGGVSRAMVWGILKDHVRRGRLRRVKVPGEPLRLAWSAPDTAEERITFRAIDKHGMPDAELLVLLDRIDADSPWAGWWDGEKWLGADGFPSQEPTHWADWPGGVR